MPIVFVKPLFLLAWLLIPLIWAMMGRSPLRGRKGKRRLAPGIMRSLLIFLLGLALADPRWVTGSDRVNLIFCMDVSESMGNPVKSAAIEWMERAAQGMGEEDRSGLIIFGKDSSLEIPLKKGFARPVMESRVDRNSTNIHDAIQLALGKFPRYGKNRIILFSDGNQNRGDGLESAHLARSLGVEIYPVLLDTADQQQDMLIEKLETPEAVPLETPFEVRLLITSSGNMDGELFLLKDGALIADQAVRISIGKNVFRFIDTIKEHGLHLYRAVVNAQNDAVARNNEGLSFTQGTRKSSVLYLTSGKVKENSLIRALRTQGLDIATREARDLPESLHGLLDYSAVILDNVPSWELSPNAMENLEKYVRDTGGGLIMIGGDKSFGAGQYLNTAVEKALPVSMDVPTPVESPGLCLILVIDKSLSMTGHLSGKKKLDGAKMAAFSAVEMLNPGDRVGVLAFDTAFQWIVPVTKADERQRIARELSTLAADGGTDLYPGLSEAFRLLKETKAAKKHIIVLSDGLTQKADFKTLIREIRGADITLSTVALGDDSDTSLMRSMADWGGGRYYYTDKADHIPRIFAGETKIVTREILKEGTMQPYAAAPGEMTRGIPMDQLPRIYGLVTTYPKPAAETLIETEKGPLLASWTYGLGKAVAFTSDLKGTWGKEWVLWDRYGQFISQMVKWTMRKEEPKNYRAFIKREGGEGTFTVDVTDNRDKYLNYLDLKLKILPPSKIDQEIALNQVSPGRYQGIFSAEETGEYYLSIFGSGKEGLLPLRTYGFAVPYSDELRRRGIDTALLEDIAKITRGRILKEDDDPREIYRTDANVQTDGKQIWPYLALLSMLLLLMEVAIRKFQALRPD